ncbi:MAG: hypothetical protein AAF639_30220 [Chloroflexota bacterium]
MTVQVILDTHINKTNSQSYLFDYTQEILDTDQSISSLPLATNGSRKYTVVEQMKQLLNEIKHYFFDLDRRVELLIAFSELISNHLWQEYNIDHKEHHSLIFSLERGIRQVNFSTITKPQLEAFEYSLQVIEQPLITVKNLLDCRSRFRAVGIETRMDWGKHGAKLAALYKEEV